MTTLWALGIPTWQIPEWMQYALAQKQTNTTVRKVWGILHDERQDTIREKIRVAPGNSASTLLSMLGFQSQWTVYPDFLEKNVLDIGGWFGWLAPVLSHSAQQITVVDPIFNEKNFDDYYRDDLRKLESKRQLIQQYSTSDIPDSVRLIRQRNLNEMDKVYKESLWWKEYDSIEEHAHIKRNPSYGENLVWIPDESQDFVFANYVLLKDTVRPEDFLHEVIRVLKKWGTLIVSDYEMKETVRELLNRLLTLKEGSIIQDDGTRFIAQFYKR